MPALSEWFQGNWFNLLQSAGVIGTLLFAAIGLHREAKAREIENVLTLAKQHHDLWRECPQRKDLERIFLPEVDLKNKPLTPAEIVFLNMVIVHFQTGWWVAKAGGITKLSEMKMDARGFFSLPLPSAEWERTKSYRNPDFVKFVEAALKTVA